MPSIVSAGTPITSARARIGPGRHLLERRVLPITVVLTHEHDRQRKHLAEVQTLEEITLIHRAITETRNRHPARPPQRQRRTRRRSNAAAHDAKRPDQPVPRRGHVHRTRKTTIDPRRPAQHLIQQPLRINTQRQRMPVTPISRRHPITHPQHTRQPHRNRLLTRIQMRRPIHLTTQKQRLNQILHTTNQPHPPIQTELQLTIHPPGRRARPVTGDVSGHGGYDREAR